MNQMVSDLLLAGETFIPEMHLMSAQIYFQWL